MSRKGGLERGFSQLPRLGKAELQRGACNRGDISASTGAMASLQTGCSFLSGVRVDVLLLGGQEFLISICAVVDVWSSVSKRRSLSCEAKPAARR